MLEKTADYIRSADTSELLFPYDPLLKLVNNEGSAV